MPNFTAAAVVDAALNQVRNTITHLMALSEYPVSYAAIAPLILAQHTVPTPAAPIDAEDGEARKIVVPPNPATLYTASGVLTHIALVNANASAIVQVIEVAEPWEVVQGRPLDLAGPVEIIMPRQIG